MYDPMVGELPTHVSADGSIPTRNGLRPATKEGEWLLKLEGRNPRLPTGPRPICMPSATGSNPGRQDRAISVSIAPMTLMGDPFREALSLKIDSVCPGASGRLDRIDEFPDPAGKAIVTVLLEHACGSQHVGHILSAREALLRLPRSWLSTVLPDAIDGAVDLGDEWEYRRLIELLKELHSELVDSYIEYGISAGRGEIFEAATDLKGR